MSKRSASQEGPSAGAPLKPRLVVGWSLFFGFVIIGLAFALFRGPGVPVLLDSVPR